MTKLQSYLLAASAVILISGCASTRETEIRPDVTPYTPTATVTQTQFRDSVVVRWVVRDSVRVHDSTAVHAVADATDFYIYSGTFYNSHGDTNLVTLDTQTGMGTCETHYGTYQVAHEDTTHQVTVNNVEFPLLSKIGLIFVGIAIGGVGVSLVKAGLV